MLFKLSNLNSNLALTLGYLNPALNNSALNGILISIHGFNPSPSHLEIFIIPDIKRVQTQHSQPKLTVGSTRFPYEPGQKTRPEKMEIILFFHFINYENLFKKHTPAIMKEI